MNCLNTGTTVDGIVWSESSWKELLLVRVTDIWSERGYHYQIQMKQRPFRLSKIIHGHWQHFFSGLPSYEDHIMQWTDQTVQFAA